MRGFRKDGKPPNGVEVQSALEGLGHDGIIVRGGGAGDPVPEGGDFHLSFGNKGVKLNRPNVAPVEAPGAAPIQAEPSKVESPLSGIGVTAAAPALAKAEEGAIPVASAPANPYQSRVPTSSSDPRPVYGSLESMMAPGEADRLAEEADKAEEASRAQDAINRTISKAQEPSTDMANAVQTLFKRQLMSLNYNAEQMAAMTPEEARNIIEKNIMAPSNVVPQIKGKSGDITENMLSGAERAKIAQGIIDQHHPPELAKALEPLSQQYHELGDQIAQTPPAVKGTPEANTLAQLKQRKAILGMQMKTLGLQAEQGGSIPTGKSDEVSALIKEALDNANAEKFASKIPVKDPVLAQAPVGPMDDVHEALKKALEDPTLTPEARQQTIKALVSEAEARQAEMGGSGTPGAQESVPTDLHLHSEPIDVTREPTTTPENPIKVIEGEAGASAAPIAEEPPPSSGGGGTTLGSGLGGFQSLLEKNPKLALRLGLGSAGALGGALYDKDNPVRGAIVGGGAGMAIPAVAAKLPDLNLSRTGSLRSLLPNIQRASLLASPFGLAVNSVLTPVGEGLMGGLEHVLTGVAERHMPEALTRLLEKLPNVAPSKGVTGAGEAGAKLLGKSIIPVDFARNFNPAMREAGTTLKGAQEMGGQLPGEAPDALNRVLSKPAQVIQAGHVAMRHIAQEAGISEQVAREITNTANPRYKWGLNIDNFAKKSPELQMLQPFARTGRNVVESFVEKTPLYHLFSRLPGASLATPAELLARYGQSGAVAGMAYELGKNTDPDTAKDQQLAKIIGHMAGQYGVVATAAFAAGQAEQAGNSKIGASINAGINNLPLPEDALLKDDLTSAANLVDSGSAHPNAEYAPQRLLPNALVPPPLRDSAIDANPRLQKIMSGNSNGWELP